MVKARSVREFENAEYRSFSICFFASLALMLYDFHIGLSLLFAAGFMIIFAGLVLMVISSECVKWDWSD